MMRVGLIGFGGWGRSHRRALAHLQDRCQLTAVAEVNQAAHAVELQAYVAAGTALYSDWRDMLSAGGFDMVSIAAPLHLHRDMAVTAMEMGFPVLCSKPAAATVQDIRAMADAAQRTGVLCAVEYQQLSSPIVQRLKQIVNDGVLGEIRRMVGLGLGRRTDAYYRRASWAGKFKVGDRYVLDGPMDNAFAHVLNNMLYLACPDTNTLAAPRRVRAEMYRAQPLPEMEDTATLIVETDTGINLLFLATYDNRQAMPYYYRVEGTAGMAVVENGRLSICRHGEQSCYLPETDVYGTTESMYLNFLAALQGKEPLLSPIEESLKLVRVQNGAYKSSRQVWRIPADQIERYQDGQDMATAVHDIDQVLTTCADKHALPSDIGTPWAKSTSWANTAGFDVYEPESPDSL